MVQRQKLEILAFLLLLPQLSLQQDSSSGSILSGVTHILDTAMTMSSILSSLASSLFSSVPFTLPGRTAVQNEIVPTTNILTFNNVSEGGSLELVRQRTAPNTYNIRFVLYTRNASEDGEILRVGNASLTQFFDRQRMTKIIIHDFNQSFQDPLLQDLKYQYLNNSEWDYNVLFMDWMEPKISTYTSAVSATKYAGATLVKVLAELEADLNLVHIIGFGVGAHIAGLIGAELDGRVFRITGLDPTISLFRTVTDDKRLDESDSQFVDIIHTDGADGFWHANHLGIATPMGHVDIYANSGIFQPGCTANSFPSYEEMQCSHTRALELFVESVKNKSSVVACSCSSWKAFSAMECDCGSRMVYVGESTPKKANGTFHLVTSDSSPLGMGQHGAFPFSKL